MSNLGKLKQVLIVATLAGLLFVVYETRGATMDDELVVDPTAPLGVSGNGGAGPAESTLGVFDVFTRYTLNSILIRGDDRIAVVNGQRVRVGESIGSATVRAIEPGNITLDVNGERETLQVYENSIKTLVKGEG